MDRMPVVAPRGYVLLEVLVALLIFSLGVLGMIAFQASSSKIVADSGFRIQAALLADELIARMAVSSRVSVQSDFGNTGPQFRAWYENRVKAAGGLPDAQATVSFTTDCGGSAVSAGSLYAQPVNVRIEWTVPERSGVPQHGVYRTCALLFWPE